MTECDRIACDDLGGRIVYDCMTKRDRNVLNRSDEICTTFLLAPLATLVTKTKNKSQYICRK